MSVQNWMHRGAEECYEGADWQERRKSYTPV